MREHTFDDYEIHRETMVLMSCARKGFRTKALEPGRTIIAKPSNESIINRACMEGGATYEGRRKAIQYVTRYQHRTPIIVNEREQIIIFPTCSTKSYDNMWVFYNHIHDIKKDPATGKTTIIFKDFSHLKINVPFRTIQLQLFRSAHICNRFLK